MSNAEIILAALAIASPIVSVIVALVVARRNKDKDTKNEGEKEGVLQSDVGYIKSSIDRVEKRLDKIDEKQDITNERLSKLEAKFEAHANDRSIHKYTEKGSK